MTPLLANWRARQRPLRCSTGDRDSVVGGAEPHACRICWAEQHDDSADGQLVSPCACSGSMRYVHVGCLAHWQSHLSVQKGLLASRKCDVCKTHWRQPYKDMGTAHKTGWARLIFTMQSLQPAFFRLLECWKAVIVARGLMTALQGATDGFRLGLRWRHLAITQQHDLLTLLQYLPFTVFATGGVAPMIHLPLILGLYGVTHGVAALQGTFMAVCGMYAGSLAGFASGVANSLLNSLHFLSRLAVGVSDVLNTTCNSVVRLLLRIIS